MSTRGTPIGFGIYDLLTGVTPGTIFLMIMLGPVAIRAPSLLTEDISITLIGFAILSLVIGEGINHLARVFYIPPTSFTRFLYEQGVDVKLGRLDSLRKRVPRLSEGRSYVHTRAGEDFWELFTSHLFIDKDYNSSWDIYNHLLGYMGPRLSQRTRRQQTIFHFVNNTTVAIIGGSIFVAAKFLLDAVGGNLTGITIVWSFLVVYISMAGLYILVSVFGFQESNYVTNLIIEYYIDRVESGDVEDLAALSIQTTLNGSNRLKE